MDIETKAVDLDASLQSLGEAIDQRMEELDQLRERLQLIIRAALNHLDGESQPHDTHLSEIIGIAKGDPNWLHHAKVNYDVKHQQLVDLCGRLLETSESYFDYEAGHFDPLGAQHAMADIIEQEIIPEMFLAEDGRVFLRGQGKPYPPEREK